MYIQAPLGIKRILFRQVLHSQFLHRENAGFCDVLRHFLQHPDHFFDRAFHLQFVQFIQNFQRRNLIIIDKEADTLHQPAFFVLNRPECLIVNPAKTLCNLFKDSKAVTHFLKTSKYVFI